MNGIVEGRIVHYVLNELDTERIIEQRERQTGASGVVSIAAGNLPKAGEHVAMMIVRVFPHVIGNDDSGINGQCLLDGNDSLWVTSRKFDEGKSPGTWHWIEKA